MLQIYKCVPSKTSASFIVRHYCYLLSLIHCHCPYSLARVMIRGNKIETKLTGSLSRSIRQYCKKEESCFRLIPFNLIIRYSTILHLPEVRQKFLQSSSDGWHEQPTKDCCTLLQTPADSCISYQHTVRSRQKGVTVSSTQMRE